MIGNIQTENNNAYKKEVPEYLMVETEMMRRAIVAGGAAALNYKVKHPKADDTEIIAFLTKESRRLIKGMEDNE